MITGMSCAACQARVEKAVNSVDGVDSCNVNLLTNSMAVNGNASKEAIIKAVEDAGYGARIMGEKDVSDPGNKSAYDFSEEEEALRDKETPVLKKRLISSVVILLILMYFSMGVHMWGWPSPFLIGHNMVASGILQMLLSTTH